MLISGLALGGCARPPQQQSLDVSTGAAYTAAVDARMVTGAIPLTAATSGQQAMPPRIVPSGNLAGRTMMVSSTADIQLRPGEVILTFDDGPRPGRTEAILDTLDDFGVKATFLMLGNNAKAHPATAQAVALRGNTVGSHTFDHADLTKMSMADAMADIAKGERAIGDVLAPIGKQPAPFFRFPYLAQSGFLRASLMRNDAVVLDVDIDSKDYYKDTPDEVAARTMKRLAARGSGIVLFHDIQARTVTMLPQFLKMLEDGGYSVVRLVPRQNGPFGTDIITAEAPLDLRGTL